MSEAATVGILRDLFAIAGVALVLGLAVYGGLRAAGGWQWNCDGNVLSRPYGWPDGVAAILLLAFLGWNLTTELPAAGGAGGGDPELRPEAVMLVSILLMVVLTLGLMTFMRVRRLDPGEMFGMRQMSVWRALWVAVGALVVVLLVMAGIVHLMEQHFFDGKWPDTGVQEPVALFQQSTGVAKVLLALAMIIVVPVYEETVFRGFLYGVTKRFTDRWFAAILTSLIFACVHRYVGGLVPLFVLAMGFAVAYELTGCLLVPMLMHALFNGWQTLTLTFFAS